MLSQHALLVEICRGNIQALVDKEFKSQIIINLGAYVDDMVIKRNTDDELIRDILETFQNLRKIDMNLNPSRCTFGVEEGQFLGPIVSPRGIISNPKKVKEILDLQPPKSLKQILRLNRMISTLDRLLSRAIDRSLPFSKY